MQTKPWVSLVGWLVAFGVPMTPYAGTWMGYTAIVAAILIAMWRGWILAGQQNWPKGSARLFMLVPSALLACTAALWSYYGGLPALITYRATDNWKQWNEIRMESVVNREFVNTEVVLDGKSFVNCKFINTTFVYTGKGPFQLIGNQISGTRIVKGTPPFDAYFVLLQGIGAMKPEVRRSKGELSIIE